MLWSIFALFLGMIGVVIAVAPMIPGNRFTKIGIGIFLVIIAVVIIANDYSWAIMMR